MKLNKKQIKTIAQINRKVNLLSKYGADRPHIILNALNDFKPLVKSIVQSVEPKQIELYLAANQGFYRYLMLCDY